MTADAPDLKGGPNELAFVRDADAARSLLDPLRRAILERLKEPGSSSSVAQELDIPRQRCNYHVRELEGSGLIRHVEDRRKGNCVERLVQATAQRYLVDPAILGQLAPAGTERSGNGRSDAFSSAALLRTAAETLTSVGAQHEEAARTGRRLPALCLEARIRFRSPRDEVEFAETMQQFLEEQVSRYHQPGAEGGRAFRVTIGGHPDAGTSGVDPAPARPAAGRTGPPPNATTEAIR